MINHLRGIIFLIFIIPGTIAGQYPDSGPDYQNIFLNNPGLTGSEGAAGIRLSYLNYYPGYGYNLFSGVLTCDGYIPSLHGGAGFFLSNDYMGGIINDLHGGFSYAYHFQAGRGLYISAGLSASLYHRGYNFSGSVLPDQIDPAGSIKFPPGEALTSEGKNVLDLATGFLFMAGRFFWGISVSHLTQPGLDDGENTGGRLGRMILFHGAGEFDIDTEKNLKLRPVGNCELKKGYFSAGAGAVFESKFLSVSVLIFGDKEKNIDLQAGFSLDTGNLEIFYKYRFNLASGSNILPFSLLHQTGIALSLNNVEKRKISRTINYPDL